MVLDNTTDIDRLDDTDHLKILRQEDGELWKGDNLKNDEWQIYLWCPESKEDGGEIYHKQQKRKNPDSPASMACASIAMISNTIHFMSKIFDF